MDIHDAGHEDLENTKVRIGGDEDGGSESKITTMIGESQRITMITNTWR